MSCSYVSITFVSLPTFDSYQLDSTVHTHRHTKHCMAFSGGGAGLALFMDGMAVVHFELSTGADNSIFGLAWLDEMAWTLYFRALRSEQAPRDGLQTM